jgi:hypothetical protein
MTYKLTKEEQETIIRRCADESTWDVYSCIPSDVNAFKSLAEQYDVQYKEDKWGGIRIRFPRRMIAYRKPVSEAMREKVKNLKK